MKLFIPSNFVSFISRSAKLGKIDQQNQKSFVRDAASTSPIVTLPNIKGNAKKDHIKNTGDNN